MSRRLHFLHYILNEDENSMLRMFFFQQVNDPKEGDWCLTIKDDMEVLDLCFTLDQIQSMSKSILKITVDNAVRRKAFSYLNDQKSKLKKVKHITFQKLEKQEYLRPQSELNQEESSFMFHAISRMLDLPGNYPGRSNHDELYCKVCCDPRSAKSDDVPSANHKCCFMW
jgi:hypothetical protein